MGIFAPREVFFYYDQYATRSFGIAKSMVCPYYDSHGGNCTVWKFRDAVCATWFCKAVAGTFGYIFWDRFRDYMIYAQEVLVLHVMKETSLDPAVILEWKSKNGHDPENLHELTPAQYESVWGKWAGKEEEFFVRAYRIVSDVAPDEFLTLSGAKGKTLLNNVQTARTEMLQPVLPPILKRNPKLKVRKFRRLYILSTDAGVYRSSAETYNILDLFDGHRPSSQVIRIVREKKNRRLSKKLLIDLYQQQILIPIDQNPSK